MNQHSEAAPGLHPLLAGRWSPRAFRETPVEKEKLVRILEAARWSASCMNEQPWQFILGIKQADDEVWHKIYNFLKPFNQEWNIRVPVLLLVCARTVFAANSRPNPWHAYDAGQAAAHLSIQARHEGVLVHQMAGFDAEKAVASFNLAAGIKPLSVIAIGYRAEPSVLSPELAQRETAPRTRAPLSSMVSGSSLL
jgi:nitroreductase